LKLVVEEPSLVKAHLEARCASSEVLATVDDISELGSRRAKLIVQGDNARASRKQLSAEIGKLMKKKVAGGDSDAETDAQVGAFKAEVEAAALVADEADQELSEIDAQVATRFELLPNLLSDDVPFGKGDQDNELVSEWGTELRKMAESPEVNAHRWHDDLATSFGGYLSEQAATLSGARFSVLAGSVARLERALVSFFLDQHAEAGYVEHSVPFIVGRSVLQGTGQLPKFEDDLFKVNHAVNGEDGFLIPTAEVPLTNLYRGRILDQELLPLRMCASTPCFRAEAGSYGRDVRGLMRQHQFLKVEMVQVCAPEDSSSEHEAMTAHAESLLQLLGLPHRKMRLCSGDVGFSASLCYDLEVWLPAQQAYREISSLSNCGDFQARRMGLRYRAKPEKNEEDDGKSKKKKASKGKVAHCHTINGSGLAVGRTLLAVLETYQRPDGSVEVPLVLRPYMGGLEELTPPPPPSSSPQKK